MSARTPMEELERLFERMSRQFEESSRALESDGPFGWWTSAFEEVAVDLVEHDDEFVVTADLPGFENDDVDVQVTDHTLRIAADREETTEEGGERYLRRERRRESTRRSLHLPGDVDKEGVSAQMRNGVLTVTLPKLEGETARTIEVE